jgi:predicted DNA-binding transcriptional regulator AlpA
MLAAETQHEILTPQDAADLLRLSTSALYELTRTRTRSRSSNPIPVIRLNAKHLRFKKSSLLAWIASCEVSR